MITKSTEEMLNRLLQAMFEGNAVVDNICYNLQYHNFEHIASAMHTPVAHKLPEFADKISDFMNLIGARPVRYAIPDHISEYNKVIDMLKVVDSYFEKLRQILGDAIANAELDDENPEVKIFLEDFLVNTLLPYCKQLKEWVKGCEVLGEEVFNRNIEKYTHFIK